MLFELALHDAKIYAALLPPSRVALSWLRELATVDRPQLANHPQTWDSIVRTLTESQYVIREGTSHEIVLADADKTRDFIVSMDDREIGAMRNRLRVFCKQRLEAERLGNARLINSVMTGDPGVEVTAWTVPGLEDVRARAAGNPQVEVVEFGDGTYSVRVKADRPWETECLKAYARREFAGDDLEGVIWALRTGLLTCEDLRPGEARFGDDNLRVPGGDEDATAFAAGLFWLSKAHKSYGEGGSCRTSWHISGKAVEILQQLRERKPHDSAVADLLAEAKKAQWAYDD